MRRGGYILVAGFWLGFSILFRNFCLLRGKQESGGLDYGRVRERNGSVEGFESLLTVARFIWAWG